MTISTPLPEQLMVLPSDQDISGRTLGPREIELVTQTIRSGVLTSTKGPFVRRLEAEFAKQLGAKHAYACSSGTSAIHAAISAIDPEPGDEVIVSPITDMGALTPILYQGAIPVFADVDDRTLNVTAATIEAKISERTKAIAITHLFGNPCDLGPILELAQANGIPVIEDCAQAFLATYEGRYVGTVGTIGCFSLQQGKHMTCGEGGIAVTNDPALARRMFLFINKGFGYGDPTPDHYFIALNSRMSELQGAVALGQFEKIDQCVKQRQACAAVLTEKLQGLKGVEPFPVHAKASCVFWKYCLLVDPAVVSDGAVGLAGFLKTRGISSSPRYIQKPAFMCDIFQNKRTFGKSQFPFTLARPEAMQYGREHFPNAFKGLEHTLVLPWNERYTVEHVEYIATAIRQGLDSLCA